MTNKVIFSGVAILGIMILIISGLQMEGKPDGAPSGNTGSPGDNSTCAHTDCHVGTAKPMDGLITTNIPETGYLSNQTYTISVTVNNLGGVRFGFQASPQNLEGDGMGEMLLTDDVQTKFVGFKKYITHTLAGNSGVDTKTWSFDWTPTTSEGDVTFYVAVNAANNDDEATGDSIYIDAVTAIEDPANIPLSVDQFVLLNSVLVNNPVLENLQLQTGAFTEAVTLAVYGLDGRKLLEKIIEGDATAVVDVNDLTPGMYMLYCNDGNKRFAGKFIKL